MNYAILATIVCAFILGTLSGTFIGSLWAKAKAWEASEVAKAKNMAEAIPHSFERDIAMGKIVAEQVTTALAELHNKAEARISASAAPVPTPITPIVP